MVEALYDKIIVKTRLRKLPKCCIQCHFYDNMGGKRGYHNNGACIIQNFKSTEGIQVTKMRLDTCPLCIVKRKKQDIKTEKAIAWLKWLRDTVRDMECRDALKLAIEVLEKRTKEEDHG